MLMKAMSEHKYHLVFCPKQLVLVPPSGQATFHMRNIIRNWSLLPPPPSLPPPHPCFTSGASGALGIIHTF